MRKRSQMNLLKGTGTGALVAIYMSLLAVLVLTIGGALKQAHGPELIYLLKLDLIFNLAFFVPCGVVAGLIFNMFGPKTDGRPRLSTGQLLLFLVPVIAVQTFMLTKPDILKGFFYLKLLPAAAAMGFVAWFYLKYSTRLILRALRQIPVIGSGILVVGSGVLVLILILSSMPATATFAGGDQTNFILLTVDTLRGDRLHYAGYPLRTSPNLDVLAASSANFSRAFTTAPLTIPGLASILTSKYCQDHGIRNNRDYALADESTTLAEIFQANNYSTGAIVANPVLQESRNLTQGFDEYREVEFLSGLVYAIPGLWFANKFRVLPYIGKVWDWEIGARYTTDCAIDWLAAHGNDKFFLWVHYFDPHLPYNAPRSFSDAFNSTGNSNYPAGFTYREWVDFFRAVPQPADKIERVRQLYDGEVLYTDHHIGRLLRFLDDSGLSENTVIVFTADHGENLCDHLNYIGHGPYAYNVTHRVPLLVRIPGRPEAGTIDTPVGTIDIAPTFLELAGLPVMPEYGFAGKSLLRHLAGTPTERDRQLFGEASFRWVFDHWDKFTGPQGSFDLFDYKQEEWFVRPDEGLDKYRSRMMVSGKYKLILTPPMKDQEEVVELFDVESDLEEKLNLAPLMPELADSLKAPLLAWAAGDTGWANAQRISISDDEAERLRALGYVQ